MRKDTAYADATTVGWLPDEIPERLASVRNLREWSFAINAAIKWPAGHIVLVCAPGNETLVAFVLPNQITNVSSRTRRGAEKRLVSYRFAVLPYISKYESPADDCVAFGALAVDAVNPCFATDVVLGFGPGDARIRS
ncbi:hypothetical protein [Rhizobium leguminosarum]|uniref:hypothetical protein n=1 Tax=Rhizobium leguminosarum TaxID=384 RepID=UPI0012DB63E2|nr:hypothetical protein [Rhizobium leguminosarum]